MNQALEYIINLLSVMVAPTITLGALLIIFRETILNLIARRIGASFDERLATLQSDLRKSEKEIEIVRSHALSGINSQSELIAAKRIESIDGIWKCFSENKRFLGAAIFLKSLNGDEINNSIDDPKVGEFIKDLSQILPLDK